MENGPSSTRSRNIALGVFLLFLVLVAFLVLRPSEGEEAQAPVLVEPLSPDEGTWVEVKTTTRPRVIDIQGRLRAEQRLELFPELQGRVIATKTPFREGVRIRKGEPILRLDDQEARLELYALRSSYQSYVASLLPDVKLDHPDQLPVVESWFDAMNPEQRLPEIPAFDSSQLKRFLTARGVFDRYYKIRSAEARLEKFTIHAPFTGEISAARVEPGQSVGPQTNAGSFIDPTSYRLTASVQPEVIGLVKEGQTVELYDEAGRGSWAGTISRILPVVDPRTQSVEIQLHVTGEGLREGAFLQGNIATGQDEALAEIPLSALRRDGSVYRVRENLIEHYPVEIVSLNRESVQVSGLSDGDRILRSAQTVLAGRQIMEATP